MSWPSGTIVVCVDAGKSRKPIGGRKSTKVLHDPLEEGKYYTVRLCKAFEFSSGHGPGVWLNEITRVSKISNDFPWSARRFRIAESPHSEADSIRKKEPANA